MSESPLAAASLERVAITRIKLATGVFAGADAGAFLIDPEKAEPFIAQVRECAFRLDKAKAAARDAGHVEASPGGDPVTTNAVVQARKMADNCWNAMDVYQQQLRATADELQAQLAAYRATEQANTPGSA